MCSGKQITLHSQYTCVEYVKVSSVVKYDLSVQPDGRDSFVEGEKKLILSCILYLRPFAVICWRRSSGWSDMHS